jgi:hypothetical protein
MVFWCGQTRQLAEEGSIAELKGWAIRSYKYNKTRQQNTENSFSKDRGFSRLREQLNS